jgi:hypothetical protein
MKLLQKISVYMLLISGLYVFLFLLDDTKVDNYINVINT